MGNDDNFYPANSTSEAETRKPDPIEQALLDVLIRQNDFNISISGQLHLLSTGREVTPEAVAKLLELNTTQLELYQKLQRLLAERDGRGD